MSEEKPQSSEAIPPAEETELPPDYQGGVAEQEAPDEYDYDHGDGGSNEIALTQEEPDDLGGTEPTDPVTSGDFDENAAQPIEVP